MSEIHFHYDDLSWKPHINKNEKPIYKAIESALENDIKTGILKAGDRLPSQRELADFLEINFTTVTRAFKTCEQKGLIFATVGKGTFVSADVNISTTTDEPVQSVIDLGRIHSLYNSNQYLADAIKQVTQSLSTEDYFAYDEPKHYISNKETGANWIKRFHFNVNPNDVFITSGTQNALAISLLSLFSPGDKIGTSRLTYTGFKSLASMAGIQLIAIDIDKDGLIPDMLEKACQTDGIKGLYIMPECQNPTTYTLPIERRKSIANIVQKYGLILIEDDTLSFLGNTGFAPVSSFAPEHSIYISGTSKALSVGLRVAFLYVANKFQDQIKHGIYNVNLTTSHYNVGIVSTLLASGAVDLIINQKQQEAEVRNQIVNNILQEFTIYGNQRDYFRWLVLPKQWTGKEFEFYARSAGVNVFSAERFMVGSDSVPSALRISLSAVKNIGELKVGLEIVKKLLLSSPNNPPFVI